MQFDQMNSTAAPVAQIRVIGVGGGGNNAVNRMIAANIKSAQFIAVNTDKKSLMMSKAPHRIQIGEKLTKGLGAGADPSVGQRAAEESKAAIAEAIKDADLVFITAGMGGGTGTGAAPVVGSIAREMGILTIGVVTKPFNFEGAQRMNNAEMGIANLKSVVDTLIIIPNDKLSEVLPKGTSLVDAFRYADDVLRQGIQGLSDLIVSNSLINLDFADIRAIMKDQGLAHMGIGQGDGENRMMQAVQNAVYSPLLSTNIEGARNVLLNIAGGPGLGLDEVNQSASLVKEVVHPNAKIIFGTNINEDLGDAVEVTIVATGFGPSQYDKNNRRYETEDESETIFSKQKYGEILGGGDTYEEREDETLTIYKSLPQDIPVNIQKYNEKALEEIKPAPQPSRSEKKDDVPLFLAKLFNRKKKDD